jgi:hypothetical protein
MGQRSHLQLVLAVDVRECLIKLKNTHDMQPVLSCFLHDKQGDNFVKISRIPLKRC